MRTLFISLRTSLVWGVAACCTLALADSGEALHFSRVIRPVLSDKCFACHGPDENKRKAGLRLDTPEGLQADRGGYRVIVPGDPDASELIKRINHSDPGEIMPPPETKNALSQEEKAILTDWIRAGAVWEDHWAFIKPQKPALPEVRYAQQVFNPIDTFIQAKLEAKGLEPAPLADRERLLRRVTMDLTGLPPSIREMDAFLRDTSDTAYERVVNRLLNSAAFAERMAMDWMDVSRYADSHGMHADGWRLMWPWRDWVIHAFMDNMPYDQFVTLQLAGDLLPNPTQDQILATAFSRNHPMTAEGGIIEEEFRLGYVSDRAHTMATAFLGLTLECARCHDHKFDPISQKDYYSLSAFFNNVNELGMTGDDGNYGPMLALLNGNDKQRLEELDTRLSLAKKSLNQYQKEAVETFDMETFRSHPNNQITPKPLVHLAFETLEEIDLDNDKKGIRIDANPVAVPSGGLDIGEGKLGKAGIFDNEFDWVSLEQTGLFDTHEGFSVSTWVYLDKDSSIQTIVGNAGNKNNFWRGWDFYIDENNFPAVKLIHSLPYNYIHVQATSAVSKGEWHHVAMTYDGTARADGLALFLNGSQVETRTRFDGLYKTIYPVANDATRSRENRALRLGKSYRAFTGEYGIFKGQMDEFALYNECLSPLQVAGLYHSVAQDRPWNLEGEKEHQIKWHHAMKLDEKVQTAWKQVREVVRERIEFNHSVPEVMVMEEMDSPRETHVLFRGQYDAPREKVVADTPDRILPFPEDYPRNRVGLAQWLFHSDHPLTARVTVNRYWQLCFGRGLVETTEDFGSQGSTPTHPDLLDWLAVTFMESGWDVKELLRTMVTSAAYRRSSMTSETMRTEDPSNQFLARSPGYRLSAEQIRDLALSASGLLVQQVGGESVKPYQPEGLWIDKGSFSPKLLRYVPDEKDKLYRRSLYTFIRRTSPPPYMSTFDAPNRDVCTVRRETTNTPLQALVLMNDPQFFEAARMLAERVQRAEPDGSPEDWIGLAFRLLTGRRIQPASMDLMVEYFEQELERFTISEESWKGLMEQGDHPVDPALPPARTAALTLVANALMNHDEFYMKR